MHKTLHYLAPLAITAVIVGCESSGGGQINRNDATATSASISSYEVRGTSFSSPGLPTPIDANQNEGRFEVEFAIEANGTVDVEVSVTEPSSGQLCGREDTKFFDADCGTATCPLSQTLNCLFKTDNTLTCEGYSSRNLSGFFDTLPKQADMVICVNRQNGFTQSAARVEFR